jgi:Dimerisation domain/O-methyltransferase domain
MNSDLTTAAPLSLPPHVQLIQMGIGGWVSAVVYHAAKMKLADHLADGPKDGAQVAAATDTPAPTMHRFMRTLAGFGILTEAEGGRFALTPMPGDTPHRGKLQDKIMLVFPGGQERTEAEYAALLAKAGFTLTRVVPTESPVSLVEAVPV